LTKPRPMGTAPAMLLRTASPHSLPHLCCDPGQEKRSRSAILTPMERQSPTWSALASQSSLGRETAS
jgi:hypothetical protein